MENSFSRFKQVSLAVLAQSNNCQESQECFRAATTVPELVSAWKNYWAEMLKEVPEQTIAALAEYYPDYRHDINLAGLYFNEAPPANALPSIVLIGDAPEATVPDASASGSVLGGSIADIATNSPLEIVGRHRVYVLGNLPVDVHEACTVYVAAERANVTVYDNTRCTVAAGQVMAHNRATVTGSGNITSYDATTIIITGGTLHDHGHVAINAYNNSLIHSFTSRRITLNDQAQLICK